MIILLLLVPMVLGASNPDPTCTEAAILVDKGFIMRETNALVPLTMNVSSEANELADMSKHR